MHVELQAQLRAWKNKTRRQQRLTMLASVLVLAGLLTAGGFSPFPTAMAQSDDVWLLVDTRALTLSIMMGDTVLQTYENIAIGSNGATAEKRVMDEKTPLGDFQISDVKTSARFQLFLPFDYPNLEHTRRAMKDGRISAEEYRALSKAWKNGEPPPQDTGLGGHLGIHGVGLGNVEIHNRFNWTNGCIAVTNEQVEELARWVDVGTRVSIR